MCFHKIFLTKKNVHKKTKDLSEKPKAKIQTEYELHICIINVPIKIS